MNRLFPLAAAVTAAAALGACSSSPPSPSWCAPLVAQFHAHETRQAYLNGLAALAKQGAPVSTLIADETAYAQNRADADSTGTGSFAAVAAGPAVLAKVSADLKQLNSDCGQPGDAYKGDNA